MAGTLRGGPLDGAAVGGTVRGAHRWFVAYGRGRARAFHGPGDNRYLYVWDADDARWTFGGFGARSCGGCGGIVAAGDDGWPLDACPLCGADLAGQSR